MKTIIMTLPVPEVTEGIQRGNHQIFPEYMKVLSDENIKIHVPDRNIIDRLNNKGIINYLMEINADVVCFGSYVWNIERNIAIATHLRKSGIITIAGGPEIRDKRHSDYFDVLINGPGEYILNELLKMKPVDLIDKRYLVSDKEIDINLLIPKYIKNTKDYENDRLLYLEIERGCPYSCSYCSYSKTLKTQNSITNENFLTALDSIYEKDLDEVYLLAPTLNRNKEKFDFYLNSIKQKKENTGKKITFFGELRPENLDKMTLSKMFECGFSDLEIGIQSLSSSVQKKTHRGGKSDTDNLQIAKDAINAGLTPIIDIIAGLPGDTIESLLETIEILDKKKLLDYTSFYHLQVLPGTEFEKNAITGLYTFDSKSPYFITDSGSMNIDGIKSIYSYLETEKDHSYYEPITITKPECFYNLNKKDKQSDLSNTSYYNTGSIFIEDQALYATIINLFDVLLGSSPEIFHIHYFIPQTVNSLFYLNHIRDIFSKYRNYYDFYRESINYTGCDVFSKQIEVIIPLNLCDKLLDLMIENEFNCGVLLPENIKNEKEVIKLSKNLAMNYDFDIPVYKLDLETGLIAKVELK